MSLKWIPLANNMISKHFLKSFTTICNSPEPNLANAALLISTLEYPNLDVSKSLNQLDQMGIKALRRLSDSTSDDPLTQINLLNDYIFKEEGFKGNKKNYDDPRNHLLNAVIERRTGIPITLGIVYIEIAQRAGVRVAGVNFPGHFLLRIPYRTGAADTVDTDLIVDPFNAGSILSETDCKLLLQHNLGTQTIFDRSSLAQATKRQIIIRILMNLKRLYIKTRFFDQGRTIIDLLLAINPSATSELRDRGLLAYHLNDFSAALRDLESYLRFTSQREDQLKNSEYAEIWEHIKTLRRRVANLN